jgi:hypothetical protein
MNIAPAPRPEDLVRLASLPDPIMLNRVGQQYYMQEDVGYYGWEVSVKSGTLLPSGRFTFVYGYGVAQSIAEALVRALVHHADELKKQTTDEIERTARAAAAAEEYRKKMEAF